MKNYLIISLLITGFSGCSSKSDYLLFSQTEVSKKPAKKIVIPRSDNIVFEYKIRPHDRISVIVYKHPELSTTSRTNLQIERGLLVNSTGDIRLPLVRRINVIGLTQTEAEDKISSAYGMYLKHPDIQIEVLNKRAYVVGEVKKPGEFELINEQLPLLQLLAKAGDVTDTADRNSILIFRGNDSTKIQTEVVSLTDKKSLLTANLMIKPNDIVYVMPNDMKAFNTGVNEISPIFRLIGTVLQPFVSIKFLSN